MLYFRFDYDQNDELDLTTITPINNYAPQGSTAAEKLAYMQEVNEAGGIRAWGIPNNAGGVYYNAGSPMLFMAFKCYYDCNGWDIPDDVEWIWTGTGFTIYMSIEGTEAVDLPIYRYNGATTPLLTLTAYAIDGVANFDLSSVVSTLFTEQMKNKQGTGLFATTFCAIENDNEFAIVHGIDDTWQRNDGQLSSTLVLLSERRDLVNWSEVEGSNLAGIDEVTIYNPTAAAISVGSVVTINAYCAVRYKVQTSAYLTALNTYFGNVFTWEQKELDACTPFLVQWLNKHGGMERWYFLHTQNESMSVNTDGVRQSVLLADLEVGTEKSYSIKTERKITCGVEGVSNDDYDILIGLAASSQIEYYDRSASRWLSAVVSKFEGKRNTDSNTQDFEIEFTIQKYPTQKQ